MAADNNKQSASDSNQTVSAAQVGDGGQASGSPGAAHSKKRTVLLSVLGAIFIILLGSWMYFGLHVGQKVYAQAAGHKIYKADVEDIQAGNKSITDRQAATVLADKYLTEAMGEENDVTVTKADLVKAYGPNVEQQKENNPYAYQNLVNQLYFTKLNAANQGTFKGKLITANFSRNVPYDSPLLPEKKAANPNLGNPTAIAADKQYANTFITGLYNQVTSGKISFDEAMAQERANPVLGEQAYPTQDHSESFNGPISQINLLNNDAVKDKLVSQKPGTITQPFVVRVPASMYNNSTTESYYLVVQLESRSGATSKVPFPQQLNEAKKELGYKINV